MTMTSMPSRYKPSLSSILLLLLTCIVSIFIPLRLILPSRRIHQKRITLSSSEQLGDQTQPSHLRLCRFILQQPQPDPSSKGPAVVIQESFHVCQQHPPFDSLLEIFTSDLLSQVAERNQLPIRYDPNCGRWPDAAKDRTTIQKDLPSPLLQSPGGGLHRDTMGLTLDVVQDLCRGCLLENESSSGDEPVSSRPDCILFPSLEHSNGKAVSWLMNGKDRHVMDIVLPTMKRNLLAVPLKYQKLWTEVLVSWIGGSGSTLLEEKRHEEDAAVIYLSCRSSSGGGGGGVCDDLAFPFHVYVEEIPTSVSRIDILSSDDCAQKGNCLQQAQLLEYLFLRSHPHADISSHVVKSTSSAYVRMITSRYLLCPSVSSCLLPALIKPKGYSVLLGDVETHPWLEDVATRNSIKAMISLLDPNKFSMRADDPFVEKWLTRPPIRSSHCRFVRGKIGRWERIDDRFAPLVQYEEPLRHYLGTLQRSFELSSQTTTTTTEEDDNARQIPYLPHTLYKWTERLYPQCKPRLLNLARFCNVVERLQLSRLFFVGDYSTLSQSLSFWKLLHQTADDWDDNDDEALNWSSSLRCGNRTIYVDFTYNDSGGMIQNSLKVLPLTKNCHEGYCYPWFPKYRHFEGRTLLVVNFGSSSRKRSKMEQSFHHFVRTMDSFQQTKETGDEEGRRVTMTTVERRPDLIFFRTGIPSHPDCATGPTEPYETLADYYTSQQGQDSKQRNDIIWHNDYVARELNKRNKLLSRNKMRMELLDVFGMTALRPDGHVSSHGGSSGIKGDCVNYALPGVVDWWNHFMFSHLEDIALEEKGEG